MEPSAAFTLIWERFVNTRGIRGHNISMDLHLEHLNNFLKELLRDLRSNLNEENADRVSKAVNNLSIIVKNFEERMEIKKKQSSQNKAKIEDVRNLCVKGELRSKFCCGYFFWNRFSFCLLYTSPSPRDRG